MQPTGRISTRGNDDKPVKIDISHSSRVSTPLIGQLVLTGSIQQLPANVLNNGVIITAKSSNANPIIIGTSSVSNVSDGTGNGYILEAGSSTSFGVTDTSVLYVIGTSGDVLSWAGS